MSSLVMSPVSQPDDSLKTSTKMQNDSILQNKMLTRVQSVQVMENTFLTKKPSTRKNLGNIERIYNVGRKKRDKSEQQENEFLNQWVVRSNEDRYPTIPIKLSPEVMRDIVRAPRSYNSGKDLLKLLNKQPGLLVKRPNFGKLSKEEKPKPFFLSERTPTVEDRSPKNPFESSITASKCKLYSEYGPTGLSFPSIDQSTNTRIFKNKIHRKRPNYIL